MRAAQAAAIWSCAAMGRRHEDDGIGIARCVRAASPWRGAGPSSAPNRRRAGGVDVGHADEPGARVGGDHLPPDPGPGAEAHEEDAQGVMRRVLSAMSAARPSSGAVQRKPSSAQE